jgi:hypothetical protein
MSSKSVDIEGNHDGQDSWARQVLEAVRGIRYGSVEVVVHDGHVVQIERRVKVRLSTAERRPPDSPERASNHIRRAHLKSGGTEPLATREEKEQ